MLHADVERIDLDKREVLDFRRGPALWDHSSVIALGSVTVMPNLPGLSENALLFHTTAHALELRNHLIDAVENAHQSNDPDERRAWLTFVVGGGGDTGIELAATIRTYIVEGLFREYPWLADAETRVVIAGRSDRPADGDPRTSEVVRQVLQSEGIEVLTGTSITGVSD